MGLMRDSRGSSGRRKLTARPSRLNQRRLGTAERLRKRAETALERSEQRYRHLVENSLGLICTHDLTGTILSVNPAAATSLGYLPHEGPGRSLKDFLSPETRHLFDEYLKRVQENKTDAGLMRVRAKDGTERVWMYRNVVCEEPEGPAYVLGHALDVTERVLAERALRESQRLLADAYTELEDRVQQRTAELSFANSRLSDEIAERARLYQEAQEANRTKEEFLATLSHELRNPLNAILGWARILRKRSVDEYASHALAVIERNAEAQTRLIDDLLDVSRITSGKFSLNLEAVDLLNVVGAALDGVRPAAHAKSIQLIDRSEPARAVVLGDANRLLQVVSNLLSNAVKFTERGGTVTIELRRTDSEVSLTVTDTGVGVASDVLPFVFDRFRQADASSNRAHGGLGLGLAIVRHLVERHGGTVSADSAGIGKGARFTVNLPVQIATEAPPLHNRALPGVGESLQRARLVLIVDDQADARELATEIVRGLGADVMTAADSREALDVLARSTPHLLIADIGLPGEDGYELIRRVRALPPERGGRIPAIALTAYAHVDDRARALASGFQEHVVKPVDPDMLARAVAQALAAIPSIEV
jgi:PAS domain S-box-containing protein